MNEIEKGIQLEIIKFIMRKLCEFDSVSKKDIIQYLENLESHSLLAFEQLDRFLDEFLDEFTIDSLK